MEIGKIDSEGYANYSSDVTDDTPEAMARFYERVNYWAEFTGTVLGEGHVTIEDNVASHNDYKKTYRLRAPVIQGNQYDAFYIVAGGLQT